MWLGLVREKDEPSMHWSDNTELDFESWAEGGKGLICPLHSVALIVAIGKTCVEYLFIILMFDIITYQHVC